MSTFSAVSAAEPTNTYQLGWVDSLAIDQPRVAVSLFDPGSNAFYPEDPNSGFTMLLDTGASGYLLAMGAHLDLFGGIFGGGTGELTYPIAGQYAEQGVGGFELMDVSTPLNITISSFLGISGVLGDYGLSGGGSPTMPGNVSAFQQSAIQALVAPNLNIGSYDGIIGMPGMTGSGVVVNIAAMTGASMDLLGETMDLFDYIHVGFADTGGMSDRLASHAGKDVLTFQFSKFDFDHNVGQIGDGPIPDHEALPLLSGVGMGVGEAFHQGTYLFDTGAQLSMISGDVARALGIDPDDPNHETLLVGGVGGEVEIPIVLIETFTLDTAPNGEGQFDRIAFDQIVVGIIDIPGLPVDGILGFNPFTTGYLNPLMAALSGDEETFGPIGAKGAFLEMLLDFTDNDDWLMHLVLNDAYVPSELTLESLAQFGDLEMDDSSLVGLLFGSSLSMGTGLDNLALVAWPGLGEPIPEPGSALLLAGAGLLLLRRRRA